MKKDCTKIAGTSLEKRKIGSKTICERLYTKWREDLGVTDLTIWLSGGERKKKEAAEKKRPAK